MDKLKPPFFIWSKIELLFPQIPVVKRREREINKMSDARYKKNGTLDMRYVGSRNYVIAELKREISTMKKEERDADDCAICTEAMRGRVTLKCGHELCPECFAQQARVNNTCPFCRDEFVSSKPGGGREVAPRPAMNGGGRGGGVGRFTIEDVLVTIVVAAILGRWC